MQRAAPSACRSLRLTARSYDVPPTSQRLHCAGTAAVGIRNRVCEPPRIHCTPDRAWGQPLRILILFGHPSQVQDIVAADEHFAKVASKLAVNPLLRARQLIGNGERSGMARVPGVNAGRHPETQGWAPCVLRLVRPSHLQIHVCVHRYQITCRGRAGGAKAGGVHIVKRLGRQSEAGHAASGHAPLYSMPHLSLATTGLPVRSLRKGFGFTGTCRHMRGAVSSRMPGKACRR